MAMDIFLLPKHEDSLKFILQMRPEGLKLLQDMTKACNIVYKLHVLACPCVTCSSPRFAFLSYRARFIQCKHYTEYMAKHLSAVPIQAQLPAPGQLAAQRAPPQVQHAQHSGIKPGKWIPSGPQTPLERAKFMQKSLQRRAAFKSCGCGS